MITVTALVLIAVILLLRPLIKWYLKRLKFVQLIDAIPGPKAWPLIGTTYQYVGVERKHFHQHMVSIKKPYPSISRSWIGPFAVVELKRAEHIEAILNSSKEHLQKAWTYKFVRKWLNQGLLTSDGDKWHRRRKIITPTFHFSILEQFCVIFAEKSQILVGKLARLADTGDPFDVCPFVTRAALDIITEAAMGTRIMAQNESDNEYVASVYKISELITRRMARPWLHPDIVYRRTADGKQMEKCLETLFGFTLNVIQQRKNIRKQTVNIDKGNQKKRLAFLDLLLEHSDELNDEDIREEVDTFMFEGHDTTTSAMTWTLFLLGHHADIQEDLYKEMDSIFHGSDRAATIHDFNEMHLLDRVIKESLRLYPAVPLIGRTLTADVEIDGYTVPAGCTILIEIYSLHRDERYFPVPETFNPDRFLPEHSTRPAFAYIPFSAGARNCIGQKFAIFEEKSILSSIIRNYRFRSVHNRDDISQIFEMVSRSLNGIWLNLEKRI